MVKHTRLARVRAVQPTSMPSKGINAVAAHNSQQQLSIVWVEEPGRRLARQRPAQDRFMGQA